MKDAVIFHPARTSGENAGAAVEMEQNEMAAEYAESAHPYKQPTEVLHIADETKNQTGYVLFSKVTKFNTWLLSRYGKRIEAELAEGIMAGEYAATMGLNGIAAPPMYTSITAACTTPCRDWRSIWAGPICSCAKALVPGLAGTTAVCGSVRSEPFCPARRSNRRR